MRHKTMLSLCRNCSISQRHGLPLREHLNTRPAQNDKLQLRQVHLGAAGKNAHSMMEGYYLI
jgi:arginine utilization protein RocB